MGTAPEEGSVAQKIRCATVFELRCDPVASSFECWVGGERLFEMSLPKGPVHLGASLCGHAFGHGHETMSWEVSKCVYGHPGEM